MDASRATQSCILQELQAIKTVNWVNSWIKHRRAINQAEITSVWGYSVATLQPWLTRLRRAWTLWSILRSINRRCHRQCRIWWSKESVLNVTRNTIGNHQLPVHHSTNIWHSNHSNQCASHAQSCWSKVLKRIADCKWVRRRIRIYSTRLKPSTTAVPVAITTNQTLT